MDGAQVHTGRPIALPDNGYLHERASGELFEFQVKWRRGASMGLFFIDVGGRAARRALINAHSGGS